MYAFELSLQYWRAVAERDFPRVLAMFAPDAVIVTPLEGLSNPATYHEWLFAAVKQSTATMVSAFQAIRDDDIVIAVQADYEWILSNDKVITFEGASIFEFTPDRQKISKLSTFYDTFLVRSHLAAANPTSDMDGQINQEVLS